MLGGQLTHHPADGIDHVGLAAPVRADHAGEIAGKADLGGIYEGFETGELNLGQSHSVSLFIRDTLEGLKLGRVV